MPANNWDKTVSLRKYRDDDLPFMQALYATTRESELAMTHFSALEKQQFVTQQFIAQNQHYRQHYCTDAFNIIELEGLPIGRLFVDYWDNEIRVVDIALLPAHQNTGLGSYLFEQLFKQARASGRTVSIHVEHNNPAKKLYERLGFELKTQTSEIYLLMEWQVPD